MVAIGFVAAGVSYLAAYLPKHAPLGPAIACLVVAVVVLVAAVVLLAREPKFAWRRFFQVAGWTLLAYIVIAGMIEYAFVYDQTRGSVLVVMTLMLVTFTLDRAGAARLHRRPLPARALAGRNRRAFCSGRALGRGLDHFARGDLLVVITNVTMPTGSSS